MLVDPKMMKRKRKEEEDKKKKNEEEEKKKTDDKMKWQLWMVDIRSNFLKFFFLKVKCNNY